MVLCGVPSAAKTLYLYESRLGLALRAVVVVFESWNQLVAFQLEQCVCGDKDTASYAHIPG